MASNDSNQFQSPRFGTAATPLSEFQKTLTIFPPKISWYAIQRRFMAPSPTQLYKPSSLATDWHSFTPCALSGVSLLPSIGISLVPLYLRNGGHLS
jgi:hypothetical protein